jgi:hypothetical protein
MEQGRTMITSPLGPDATGKLGFTSYQKFLQLFSFFHMESSVIL